MANVRLKVLHGRSYRRQDGTDAKFWTQVGTAWMNDKGIELELNYVPTLSEEGRGVRLVLREDDGRPAQPQGGYRG